jgi:endonuclease/exonuclease/phosphatase (EEP) superfamily protein YafD
MAYDSAAHLYAMIAVLYILAGAVVTVTILPVIRHEAWWIRIFDFPRIQIVAIAAMILVAILIGADASTARIAVTLSLLLAIAHHLYRILPFSPLWRRQVAAGNRTHPTVSLLVANVLMTNRDSAELFRIIEEYDPDIILAVETDDWWTDAFDRFSGSHPYGLDHPQANTYGLTIRSRLPAEHLSIRYLVQDDVPSVVGTFVLDDGATFRFFGLHPRPPHPTRASETTPRDAELLIVGREVKETDGPVIVAGDLNDVAWSHTTRLFQRVSGLLDPRRGRGMFNTFHAGLWFARWPLDHIFHSRHFCLDDLKRLPAFGSDHFPVFARLVLSNEPSVSRPDDHADEADVREVQRKLDKVEDDEIDPS